MSLLMNISILAVVIFTNFLSTTSGRHAGGKKRMINGKNADIENWTFLAQLVFEPDYFLKTCSATLFTKQNLMTAAHCVEKLRSTPDKLKVKIPTKTKSNEWTTTTYEVKMILVHPNYDNSERNKWDNDNALIVLKRRVPKYIKPASIANVTDEPSNCKAAGWGSTTTLNDGSADVENKNYEISETLQEINVPLVPWGKCKDPFSKTHEEFEKKNKMVFCGGSIGAGKEHKTGDGCIGDNGSPLICDGPNGKMLSGVMLAGNPDCLPGKHYMIFTDVAMLFGRHKKILEGGEGSEGSEFAEEDEQE